MWEKRAWGPTQKIDPVFKVAGERHNQTNQLRKTTNEFTI